MHRKQCPEQETTHSENQGGNASHDLTLGTDTLMVVIALLK